MIRWIAIEVVALFTVCCLGLFCCRCSGQPLPQPTPPVAAEAGADPCASGCVQANTLGCAFAASVVACTARCDLAAGQVQWMTGYVGPKCWANAGTKAAMQACPGVEAQDCP